MRHAAFHYVVLLVVIAAAAPASARTWINRAGKTLEADFVRLDGDKVVLLIGGKETPVALDQLSDADQAFAREQAAGSAPAAEPASAVTDITKRRKWTDVAGSTITAAFGGIERDVVGFIDGRQTRRVPFASLCDADQALICRFLESRGLGLSIPPGVLEISKQPIRVWTDHTGRAVQGILRQIEPEGQIVLQTARSVSRLPFNDFSDSDQEHLRKVAEEWELVENLPADKHLRTWHDWLGNAFSARLDPSYKPQHWSSQIHFLSAEKDRFSKDFTELSQADRAYVLKLTQAAGGGRFLKSFPEPESPAREWAIGGTAGTQTARFVGLERGQVVLRTASDPAREVSLSSMAAADRRFVRDEMRRRGQEQLIPLLRDECREWIYGPAGIGNVLVGQLDGAAGSVVRLRLPDANYAREAESKTAELSFIALSPADQEFVTTSLKIDRNSLLPNAAAIPLAVRDWKLDGGRQAIRGSLVYVVPSEIFVGDVQSQRGATFASLSAADQEYVCRAVVTYGQTKFDRPPPPPRTGVVRIDPTPPGRGYVSTPPTVRNYPQPQTHSAPQPGRGSGAYQAGQVCGSFTCIGILIFLVILLVTRMSQ